MSKFAASTIALIAALAGACDMPGTNEPEACGMPEIATPDAIDQSTVVADRGFLRAKAQLTGDQATMLIHLPDCAATHGIAVAVTASGGAILWVTARAKDSHVVDEARTGGGGVELASGPDVKFIGIAALNGAIFSGDVSITVLK